MSMLLSTNYRTHSKSFSFDSAQIFNQMFSRRKSLSTSTSTSSKSSIAQTTPSQDRVSEKEGEDRRRSASDIPISKPIVGRRKSDDAATKRLFFRKRSKEKHVDLPSPTVPEKKKEKQRMTEEDSISIPQSIPEATKPIAYKTHSEPTNHVHTSILELSESPKRVSQIKNHKYIYSDSRSRLSATPPPGSGDEDLAYKCPSSPLLVAVRTAVDSLSQYNDFEILEKIGSGFYAEVFKVRYIQGQPLILLLTV